MTKEEIKKDIQKHIGYMNRPMHWEVEQAMMRVAKRCKRDTIDYGIYLLRLSENIHNKRTGQKKMSQEEIKKLSSDMYIVYKRNTQTTHK